MAIANAMVISIVEVQWRNDNANLFMAGLEDIAVPSSCPLVLLTPPEDFACLHVSGTY